MIASGVAGAAGVNVEVGIAVGTEVDVGLMVGDGLTEMFLRRRGDIQAISSPAVGPSDVTSKTIDPVFPAIGERSRTINDTCPSRNSPTVQRLVVSPFSAANEMFINTEQPLEFSRQPTPETIMSFSVMLTTGDFAMTCELSC